MKYNPEKHHHKNNRLKEYENLQVGLYFITLGIPKRFYLFEGIEKGKLKFAPYALTKKELMDQMRFQ